MRGSALAGSIALAAATLLAAGGCSTAYYGAMEQLGQHKRDILKSRIESGREEQQEAQAQFKTTYQRFKEVAGSDGGDLEAIYERLNAEYERSEARAQDVRDRIASIEQVSGDFFLKHNLNVRAIASLSGSLGEIESDVDALIRDIDASIRESESFLATLETTS